MRGCLIAILFAVAQMSVAQSPATEQPLAPLPAPTRLEELRKAFHQRVRLASGALNDYYEKALAALELDLAALGKYEEARAVKSRRADLASLSASEAAPADATAAPDFKMQLKDLKSAQMEALKSAQQPVVDAYLAKLGTMTPTAPDDAEAIAGEEQRVRRMIVGKVIKPSPVLRLESFDEITGAHFIPDPSNTGDRITVEHDGQAHSYRLAWVTCAPLNPNEVKAMQAVMNRFEISAEAALSLGRAAQEFTSLYLEGRPLRLLVHQRKNADLPEVLVFVEGAGLLQNALVDQALAMVEGLGKRTVTPAEQSLWRSLQEREASARKRMPRVGGWAIKGAH